MTQKHRFIFETDQLQARRQLEYLGYKPGASIYLRFFYPSGDPRKDDDKGRKLDRLSWKQVQHYQQDGRGVYVVVNGAGGGHEDKDIKQCSAIFCEWDDRPLEEQLLHWETVGFLEPTFTIYSGGKSAHPYWVFDQPITVEQWRELQRLLIEVMGADPSNKNPSRVFRLAGGWHIQPGREPVQSEILQDSGRKYSYAAVRQELLRLHSAQLTADDVQQKLKLGAQQRAGADSANSVPQYQRYEDIQVPVSAAIPLYCCLSKESRTLIDSGVSQGGRNSNGAKLARDLIGTANHLQTIGQRFDDQPRQLLDDYASRCTPPLPEQEVEAIWKSAQKDNPSPSCQPEGVEACIKGWYWKEHVRAHQLSGGLNGSNSTVTGDTSQSGDSSNVDTTRFTATVTTVTIILKQGLDEWEEQAKLDALQIGSGVSKASFAQLVAAERCKLDEVGSDDQEKLNQLIEWKNTRLDFTKVLPHLADKLLHDGRVLNIDPIMLLQYLLPATLSLAGKRVELDVNSHKVPAIAWTCSVGESGIGKSRAEGLILSPLKEWQRDEYHRFKAEWDEYKSAKDKKGEEGSEPAVPPVSERKYLFEVATIQAVMRRLSEQGENGSLWARDEIAGLFKSLGQFTSKGEGEGLECLLPMWDGASSPVDRVLHEDSYHLENSRLSIAGGLQPGVFRKIFKDPDDAQGLQARFLFALPQVQPAKRVKGGCQLAEELPHFYRWVDSQFPSGTLKLSRAADARYDAVYEQIGKQAEAAETPAIRAWTRKLPGQLLRIVIALHIIECYHEPGRARHEIQLDTLNRAVEMCRYYRSAFQVVQESVSDSDSISSILLKIWDQAATSPKGLAVRDAYRSIKAIGRRAKELNRDVAAYTLDLYYQLEKAGRGVVQRTGRLVKFWVGSDSPPTDSPPSVTTPVTVVTVAQNEAEKELVVSPEIVVSPVTVENLAEIIEQINLDNEGEDLVKAEEVELITTEEVQVVDETQTWNELPASLTVQELASQILLCETWMAIALGVNQEGERLKQATAQMTREQRQGLSKLLAEYLCKNPSGLKELGWLPVKLRERALLQLSFTIERIGGDMWDAVVEYVAGCRLVVAEHLGTRRELWIWQLPSGENITAGIDAIQSVELLST